MYSHKEEDTQNFPRSQSQSQIGLSIAAPKIKQNDRLAIWDHRSRPSIPKTPILVTKKTNDSQVAINSRRKEMVSGIDRDCDT